MEFLVSGHRKQETTSMLARGAGAEMVSDSMNSVAPVLSDREKRIAGFEFSYMAARHARANADLPRMQSGWSTRTIQPLSCSSAPRSCATVASP